MRALGIATGALVISVAGAAFAQSAAPAERRPASEDKGRILYVCDRSQQTEKSFERLYGKTQFVTAQEALSANRRHETWAAPRCIDGREYQKLMVLVAEQQQTIRLSAR